MIDWINALFDGTLYAGGVFLVIGIVGVVVLLFSFLLDGVFDLFDGGDGPLSLTTVGAFATLFGFTAFGCVGAGVPVGIAALLGAIAGVLGGFGAWWLTRSLRNDQSNTSVTTSSLVGETGMVVLAIPGGSGFGEIALTKHGERVSLSATAAEDISRGTQVIIVHTLSATSVAVEPYQSADENR
ncbi:MAG: hypothetical protein ACTJGT_10225 [Microbacteriaceae bacterium]